MCRTCSALLPHLCRTCAALVPHLCRTCAALWADLRRGALWPVAVVRFGAEIPNLSELSCLLQVPYTPRALSHSRPGPHHPRHAALMFYFGFHSRTGCISPFPLLLSGIYFTPGCVHRVRAPPRVASAMPGDKKCARRHSDHQFRAGGKQLYFFSGRRRPAGFFLRAFFAGEEERMWKGAGD